MKETIIREPGRKPFRITTANTVDDIGIRIVKTMFLPCAIGDHKDCRGWHPAGTSLLGPNEQANCICSCHEAK